MWNRHDDNVDLTYLALRLGMVLLVGLLFFSVAYQIIVAECLQRSISAYYFTSTRSVFVGTLCAIGLSLIAYRGNTDTENVLLDFSGFLAFVVAFVPTAVDKTCDSSNVPTAEEIASGVRNNVTALLLTGALATLVGWYLWRTRKPAPTETNTLSRNAKWSLALSSMALLAGIVFFVWWPEEFQRVGHNVSALALFVGIVAVVVVNAWGFSRGRNEVSKLKAATNRYGVVAILMLISFAGLGVWRLFDDGFIRWVFFLEATLISLFAVFWVMQTAELGARAER